MIKTTLQHPQIFRAIASAGHGSKILIADGNFPSTHKNNRGCEVVYLNLAPGLVSSTDVLGVLREIIAIETVTMMAVEAGNPVAIQRAFIDLIGSDIPVKYRSRFDFYSDVHGDDTVLIIVTGEQRRYGNILLEVGTIF